MFTISNSTDYAMLFISYLSRQKKPISMSKAIVELGLPRRYMAQIGAKLAGAQIVASQEGVSGGYQLKKPLNTIKLYDVLKLFEGDLKLVKCSDGEFKCQWGDICNHKHFWKNVLSGKLLDVINSTTIEDLFVSQNYANSKKSLSTN